MAGAAASAPGGSGSWDPGLQPERTALAWQRTALAATGASLVAFRQGVVAADPVVLVPALVAFVGAVVVLRTATTELAARLAALHEGRPLPAPTAVPAGVLVVLALAASTVAVLLR